jgi:hypothetical protein
VNRCIRFLRATSRTRSSALSASIRRCVRDASPLSSFPLARSLPSGASAMGCPTLFDEFFGTTERSDFSGSYVIGVRPSDFPMRSRKRSSETNPRSPGSRVWSFRAC